jgi:hypothetical protein
MPLGRTAAATLAGAALLGIATPAVSASVSPDPVAPGQRLVLDDDHRCDRSMGAVASSPLFGVLRMSAEETRMIGGLRVPGGARPGDYPLTIACGAGGATATGTVTVAAAPHAVPAGAVRAGLGGPADARTACGAALLVLGGHGALLWWRRRMPRRRTDGKV